MHATNKFSVSKFLLSLAPFTVSRLDLLIVDIYCMMIVSVLVKISCKQHSVKLLVVVSCLAQLPKGASRSTINVASLMSEV
jgi:hypothetical protein